MPPIGSRGRSRRGQRSPSRWRLPRSRASGSPKRPHHIARPPRTRRCWRPFRTVRSNGQFVPPSTEGTVIFPGFDGGGEWGGSAFDPKTGRLFVNANEMAWILTMVRPEAAGNGPAPPAARSISELRGLSRRRTQGRREQMVPGLIGTRKELARAARSRPTGKGVMPSFASLSAAARGSIVAFLFGDRRARPTAANPSEAARRDRSATRIRATTGSSIPTATRR